MSLYGGLGANGLKLDREKVLPASAGHNKRAKYRKAPGAPKRFKSAFIFFSTEKHKEIRAEMGEKGSAEKVCCEKNDGKKYMCKRLTPISHFHSTLTIIDYQRG